ncbi:ATP-binding protein [Sphingorhabdus sp. EL138]|uniref:sensor histidine kinase n=1 Tax=Sphingorhabdus sp. EL138 TaxID=2073156 RepID=UPI0025D513EE|nr:ATP-binding protein [Sphingorhabdus sp. EL138]
MLYASSLLAFSIIIYFSISKSTYYQSILWIFSNAGSAFAMLIPSVFVETTYSGQYNFFSYVLSGASIILPYFALAGPRVRLSRYSRPNIILAAAVAVMLMSAALPFGWLPLALGYAAGGVILWLTGWVCHKNPLWRWFWGKQALIFGLSACALLFLWRAWIVSATRDGAGFDIDPSSNTLGLEILIFSSFCMQIGFLNLIIGRPLRLELFAARRATRFFENSKRMSAEENRLADLARERLMTLGLLKHVVRQPINNARAALEALDYAVKAKTPMAVKSKLAIARANDVLDAVTLAISNAIFGASFLEENANITPRSVDAYDVARLAKTDCPTNLVPRIEINSHAKPVFVNMDPVLVRLALRNLLDNALKYSPPHSLVQFCILQREDLFGASFNVTSKLSGDNFLDETIFSRHRRGARAKGGGSGLGLYLVKKVAEAHGGSVSFLVHDNATVTFELFLPD